MASAEKQTIALIGALLLGGVLGCARSEGQNGAPRRADEIDRLPKSVEDLLFDLKKYNRLHNCKDERNETRAALVAMGRPIVPRLCEALRDKERYGTYERIRPFS